MIAGWQQGNITYDDEPLKDIIADIERIYNVNIRISNDMPETENLYFFQKRDRSRTGITGIVQAYRYSIDKRG